MIRVLVIAAGPPARPNVLGDSLRRLATSGATVSLLAGFPADQLALPEGFAQITTLAPLPARQRRRRLPAGEGMWMRFQRDAAARRAAARADVLVALDLAAVHTVWQLAQRHRGADAVLGLAPALRSVQARGAHRVRHTTRQLLVRVPSTTFAAQAIWGRIVRRGKAVARAVSGTRVHRLRLGRAAWRLFLQHVPMPDRVRLTMSRRVAESLTRAGYADQAAQALTGVARKLPQLRQRATFLADAAGRDLGQGRSPAYLLDAAAAEIAVADAAFAADDIGEAARSIHRAMRLLLHRGLHFDSLESPAAPDPTRFLAPWHNSAVARALATARGRSRPAAVPEPDRPHRILFLYCTNANFLGELQHRYDQRDDTEIRSLDILDDPVLREAAFDPVGLIEHLLVGSSEYGERVAQAFRPHLEWADTVWVDWCTNAAALLTAVDPGSVRIVLRLHSFEVFTEFPHLIDPSRIDDLVFVSEHLRDYAKAVAPRLAGATRTPVLINAMDLRGYQRPKPDSARFTVGLVGISAIAKDPRWAVQVLRILRRHDERYRLLLIGSDLDGRRSQAGVQYQRQFEADLRELEPSGAVRRHGPTNDVPAALADVGVILSSSVRESFHCGLAEGAASHAVPVVRDWPFFAGLPHGARTLFPADWVVDTPEQAAARILATTSSDEVWRRTGAAAAAHALTSWDWSVTAPTYDYLLLGTDTAYLALGSRGLVRSTD
jgi:glycosyltransferase involved in cell wall biosynthesis